MTKEIKEAFERDRDNFYNWYKSVVPENKSLLDICDNWGFLTMCCSNGVYTKNKLFVRVFLSKDADFICKLSEIFGGYYDLHEILFRRLVSSMKMDSVSVEDCILNYILRSKRYSDLLSIGGRQRIFLALGSDILESISLTLSDLTSLSRITDPYLLMVLVKAIRREPLTLEDAALIYEEEREEIERNKEKEEDN